MKSFLLAGLLSFVAILFNAGYSLAQTRRILPTPVGDDFPEATASATFLERITPTPVLRAGLTRETEEWYF